MKRHGRFPTPFNIIDRRIYSNNRCFYCGKLVRGTKSREHVFPRWLQKKFQLENQKLTLLNGTTIMYKQLTVPCCIRCNNVHLSRLENRVKRLLFECPLSEARRHLDQFFIWVIKILLAIIYAERMLPLDRRRPKGKPILPSELRDAFRMTHFFIQSLTIPMRFLYDNKERIPGSVFLFSLKSPKDVRAHFDFKDNPLSLSVFMRLGNRGLLAVADGGALDMEIGDLLRRDGKRKLHPLQFEELGAKTFYKAGLFNRTPKYLMFKVKDVLQIMQMPLAGLSSRPIFNDWEMPVYAQFLSAFTGLSIDQIAPGDRNKVMQWFTDPGGKPLNIPIKPPRSLGPRGGQGTSSGKTPS
jgi:hypothetical protein